MKLNFDIIYMILKMIEIDDIFNFIKSSKTITQMYMCNMSTIDSLISQKILKYFHFNKMINIKNDYILVDIYSHFKKYPYSSRVDFLIYMIDKKYTDENLFRFFTSFCYLNHDKLRHTDFIQIHTETRNNNVINNTNDSYRNYRKRSDISFSGMSYMTICDIKYIIVYSLVSQLDIILETYNISEIIMAHAIEEMLIKMCSCYVSDTDNYELKIKKCIDYVLERPYHIQEIQTMYYDYIVRNLMYYKQKELLNYIKKLQNFTSKKT